MDQLAKIKEAVLPLLNAHDIQLYDVCWTNEGRNKILQIAMRMAVWILMAVLKWLS